MLSFPYGLGHIVYNSLRKPKPRAAVLVWPIRLRTVSAASSRSRCVAIGCPALRQSAARSVQPLGSRPRTRGVVPRAGSAPWRARPVRTATAPGRVVPRGRARCRGRGWSAAVASPIHCSNRLNSRDVSFNRVLRCGPGRGATICSTWSRVTSAIRVSARAGAK